MKRFTPLIVVLVLGALSCADTPTDVASTLHVEGAAYGSQLTQAGDGNAWHGYDAPSLEYDATASPLELCSIWTDPRLAERDGGLYADTDFFSFTFRWRAEGAEEWDQGSARNAEGTERGCHVVGELAEGRYDVTVTAMARHQARNAGRMVTTTHHTNIGSEIMVIGEATGPAYTVELSPVSATIIVGGSQAFEVTVTDDNANEVTDAQVTWASDDTDVALVDATGLATGMAVGTARISASYQGVTAGADLEVEAAGAPSSTQTFRVGPAGGVFSLFAGAVVMDISPGALDQEMEIGVTPAPIDRDIEGNWVAVDGTAYVFTPAGLQFQNPVSSPVFLTIGFDPADLPDYGELFSGKVRDGKFHPLDESSLTGSSITAAITSFSFIQGMGWCGMGMEVDGGACVVPGVETVTIDPGESHLAMGGWQYLLATAHDAYGNIYYHQSTASVQWSSSDESIATVVAETSRRATVQSTGVGTATITATLRGVSGEATVIIETEVVRVEVTPSSASVDRNQTQQYTATAYDRYDNPLTSPTFAPTWSSAHPCFAAVDADGLATGLNPGTATIVADIHGVTGSGVLGVQGAAPGSVPSSLQGDWAVCDVSTGAYKLTLHLTHEAGEELVTGTVTMANGSSGRLSPSYWRSGETGIYYIDFSWTVHVSGGDRTFSIFDANPHDEHRLIGDYNDRYFFSNYPVMIVRALDDR
jgi:uncharacterized protein YjdB